MRSTFPTVVPTFTMPRPYVQGEGMTPTLSAWSDSVGDVKSEVRGYQEMRDVPRDADVVRGTKDEAMKGSTTKLNSLGTKKTMRERPTHDARTLYTLGSTGETVFKRQWALGYVRRALVSRTLGDGMRAATGDVQRLRGSGEASGDARRNAERGQVCEQTCMDIVQDAIVYQLENVRKGTYYNTSVCVKHALGRYTRKQRVDRRKYEGAKARTTAMYVVRDVLEDKELPLVADVAIGRDGTDVVNVILRAIISGTRKKRTLAKIANVSRPTLDKILQRMRTLPTIVEMAEGYGMFHIIADNT